MPIDSTISSVTISNTLTITKSKADFIADTAAQCLAFSDLTDQKQFRSVVNSCVKVSMMLADALIGKGIKFKS